MIRCHSCRAESYLEPFSLDAGDHQELVSKCCLGHGCRAYHCVKCGHALIPRGGPWPLWKCWNCGLGGELEAIAEERHAGQGVAR